MDACGFQRIGEMRKCRDGESVREGKVRPPGSIYCGVDPICWLDKREFIGQGKT